jgi:predicted enzyme related to lactoylglutathione lyase
MKNHICYFEIGCRDRAKASAFYSRMFDWTLQDEPASTRIRTGGDVGGHITSLGHEPHDYTIFYVMVDNVASALEKAVTLGGRKLVGPVPLPNSTEFGWFADPEGNVVGVYGEIGQARQHSQT